MGRPVVNLCEIQKPKTQPAMSTLRRLMRSKQGAIFSCLSAIIYGVLIIVVYPPIFFFLSWMVGTHYALRRFIDICLASWLTLVNLIFEHVFRIKTNTFGYRGKFKRRCVFIMNHVSHLDWMYTWSVMARQGDLSTWKVVTKEGIRHLPILGQCMQVSCFLFIARNWAQDEKEFRDKLDYYNSLDYPFQILLFPEGGDLTYKSKQKSDEFAKKQGLPPYDYCLHPRTRGFTYIINALREHQLDAVYDLTIAYPDALPKTEVDFLSGLMPREVDFHIKSYDDKDVPVDDEGIGEWCQDRWREKDELLHSYYTHGTFVEPVVNKKTGTSNGVHELNHSQASENRQPTSTNRMSYLVLAQYMLLLFVMNAFAAYLLYVSWLFLAYFLLSFVGMFWLSRNAGGFDKLLLAMHKKGVDEYVTKKRNHTSNGTHRKAL